VRLKACCGKTVGAVVAAVVLALPASAAAAPVALPLTFEPNLGQAAAGVLFIGRTAAATVLVAGTELRLAAPGADHVRLRWVGANPEPAAEPLNLQPARVNYFLGNDPTRWRADVPTYGRVRVNALYPGVDLVLYGNDRRLEYDLVVAAGFDPASIELAVEGGPRDAGDTALSLDADGSLRILTPAGEIVQAPAVVYQDIDGTRVRVASGYELRGGNRVGFCVDAYDPAEPLVIDPTIVFSTYLGGNGDDFAFGLAGDSAGNAYVIGGTNSTDFPMRNPYDGTLTGGADAVVAKLDATGQLVFVTYLGGNGGETPYAVKVDTAGSVYVTGITYSSDFPADGYQQQWAGAADCFVTKVSASGSALLYSTYLGGGDNDQCRAIALDADGAAYVTGLTWSTDFPTATPVQAASAGGGDAFVTKLNAAGTALVYSTYLGGTKRDEGLGIAVDGSGNAVAVGFTSSTDFRIANAYQNQNGSSGSNNDAFVTELTSSGSSLVFSTYLGGASDDGAHAVAVDASGAIYITGWAAHGFPTVGSIKPCCSGGYDAFVSKLSSTGATLHYSSVFGAEAGGDRGYGIAVDGAGAAFVAGYTNASDFPAVDPVATYSGMEDAFIAKLSPAGNSLAFSSPLGGTHYDRAYGGVAFTGGGDVLVAGQTVSTDFPVVNPAQAAKGGGWGDFFLTRISMGLTCTLACNATVPPTGRVGQGVQLDSTVTPTSCSGTPTVDWDFGDGSPHSGAAAPLHTYTSVGTYTWTLTAAVSGVTCTKTGTITISPAPTCTITCNATVPATAQVGVPLTVQASSTATGCSGTPAYWWQFGETTARIPAQNLTYTYQLAGNWPWNMSVEIGSDSCAKSGAIAVAAAPAFLYAVPSVAHAPGATSTQWRTNVAAVNRSGGTASLTFTYLDDARTIVRTATLANGATAEWSDILVSLFGLSSSTSAKGTLLVGSDRRLAVTSRTFNQAAAGTYGQYYPALTQANAIAAGSVGIIPQIKKNAAFRTNLGVVNLGTASCVVAVKVFNAAGAQVGTTKQMTVPDGRWQQQDDIFGNVAAGNQDIAYATVEVLTAAAKAWAYASVVDNATGDPTTMPVIVP
jgi:hypothetical protein